MAAETLRRHIRTLLLRQQRRCGVAFADCCCGSRGVEASHLQTVVAAAETLRRHTRRPLLRQQRRCGVTFAHCCCGSRDVAASHSQTAVAAAETLRRRTRRLLLRQQIRCIAVAPALVVTQLSACDGVHHTSSCRDRSTYAVVEYIVPAPAVAPAPVVEYIAPAPAASQLQGLWWCTCSCSCSIAL